MALARALYEVARAKGVGQMFDLVGSGSASDPDNARYQATSHSQGM